MLGTVSRVWNPENMTLKSSRHWTLMRVEEPVPKESKAASSCKVQIDKPVSDVGIKVKVLVRYATFGLYICIFASSLSRGFTDNGCRHNLYGSAMISCALPTDQSK